MMSVTAAATAPCPVTCLLLLLLLLMLNITEKQTLNNNISYDLFLYSLALTPLNDLLGSTNLDASIAIVSAAVGGKIVP